MQTSFKNWHLQGIGLMRIAFGVIWAIDAQFKWQPDFLFHFTSFLAEGQDGQPDWIKAWIEGWIHIVSISPVFFAVIVALAETALAISLLFGVMSNLAYFGGALLTVVIWATAEGFGGPYVAGSTDVGTGIIYTLVFALLFFSRAGLHLGLDGKLGQRLGSYAWLASGRDSKD